MKRSKLSIPLRIFIVIVGALVVFVGLAMRTFEQDKPGGLGHVTIVEDGGTVTVYEATDEGDQYGVEPIASEWGVFYYSEAGDSHTEVFRGTEEEAYAFHAAMGEDFDLHGVEPIASAWGVFHYTDDGETRTEVFRGSELEANAYYDAEAVVVAFTGTQAEFEVWEQAQQEAATDLLPANLTIAAGALIILAGLGLGWRRRPERFDDAGATPQDLVGVGR